MSDSNRPYALNLRDRDNLDDEMRQMVKGVEKKYGFVPNFVKFFATDNKRLRAFMLPYMELMRPDSGLSHVELEMIALVSAATNGCFYCQMHHSMLMREVTGDTMLAEQLSRNYHMADLSPRHRAMLDYVVKVQKDAEGIDDADRDQLRQQGFDDEAIWSVTSTACFYAMANRMAQAIGLQPLPEYADMYRGDSKPQASAG